MLPEWQEGLERKSAGNRVVGVGCIGGTVVEVVGPAGEVVLVVLALAVGAVQCDSDARGLTWSGWGASFLLLLAALAQLETQRVGNKVTVKNVYCCFIH